MSRKSVPYRFDNGRGQKLAGIIDMPSQGEPDFFGIFAPCFTCPKETHAAAKVCRHMAENGAAMLRFDITGNGQSEGDFAHETFTNRIADIVAAAQAVEKDHGPVRLVVGHSISGTAALSAALELPDVQAVATIGSPRDPGSVMEKFRRQNLITPKGDQIEIVVIGQRFTFAKTFPDDMTAERTLKDTAKLDKKLFIFHAPHDNIVSFESAQVIYDRAVAADREIVRLDDAATHLFENRKEDAEFVAETLLDWFRVHLR